MFKDCVIGVSMGGMMKVWRLIDLDKKVNRFLFHCFLILSIFDFFYLITFAFTLLIVYVVNTLVLMYYLAFTLAC